MSSLTLCHAHYTEPTEVVTKPMAGYRIGRPDRLGPGKEVIHDRNPFHREKRLQETVYEIAADVLNKLKDRRNEWEARHILFPQVLNIVGSIWKSELSFLIPIHPLKKLCC